MAAVLMLSFSAAAQPGNGQSAYPSPPGGRPLRDMNGGGPSGFPGGPGMGPRGDRPPVMDGEFDLERIERFNIRQDKRLRKILGEELYARWRSRHPLGAPKPPRPF